VLDIIQNIFNNRDIYTVKSANHFSLKTFIDNSEFRVPGNWLGLLQEDVSRLEQVCTQRVWTVRCIAPTVMAHIKMNSMPFLVVTRQVRTGWKQTFGADYHSILIKQMGLWYFAFRFYVPSEMVHDMVMILTLAMTEWMDITS